MVQDIINILNPLAYTSSKAITVLVDSYNMSFLSQSILAVNFKVHIKCPYKICFMKGLTIVRVCIRQRVKMKASVAILMPQL